MSGKSGVGSVGALLVVLLGGCTPAVSTGAQAGPTANVRSFVGGCAGTVLTDAEPPVWAQGGGNVKKGDPWSVPWALGTGGEAVASRFTPEGC
jgi:hypothetical protein